MTKTNLPFQRNTALDVFRGLTVCFMIIVNTSGNGDTTYWPLKHADWNGFTPTDLVFPSFLFAVGNALSFVTNRWQTMKQLEVLMKIFKRTFLIFLIGYLMYWFPFFKLDAQSHLILSPISNTRIFGVLQRIALCYGISALLLYYLGTRKTIWIGIASLLLYWLILLLFGESGAEFSKHGNAVLSFDTWLIGINHLYRGEGFPFDPEGFTNPADTILQEFNYIKNPDVFDKSTPDNPFSNVLIPDYEYNTDKKPAPPAFNSTVNNTILEQAKQLVSELNPGQPDISDKLFKDLGEQYVFEQSLRQFNSNPSTTIPNDQQGFAEFCYGSMVSSHDGNPFALARNLPRHNNY